MLNSKFNKLYQIIDILLKKIVFKFQLIFCTSNERVRVNVTVTNTKNAFEQTKFSLYVIFETPCMIQGTNKSLLKCLPFSCPFFFSKTKWTKTISTEYIRNKDQVD